MISGGYSALGKSGNTAVVAGTVIGAAVGSAIPGIGTAIGAAIGGALGGVANRLFGRKLAGTGLEGSFGAGNFSGTNYEYHEGGTFRSDKTKRSDLDPQVDALLDTSFATLQTKTALMATVLGQSASAINAFTSSIKLDFKGLTDKEIEEKIGAVFDDMGNSMASLIPGLEAVTKFGESSSAALTRLYDSIFAVNGVIDTLNLQLFDVSLTGAAMASSLADAFGGMDKLQAATSAYYSAFYTEEQRIAESTQQLTQAMSNLGYALPASKEGFRDVVAGLNLTTAAGQQTFAALMGLAPMFAEVSNSWEAAAKELKNTKAQIDQIGRTSYIQSRDDLVAQAWERESASGSEAKKIAGSELDMAYRFRDTYSDAGKVLAKFGLSTAYTDGKIAETDTKISALLLQLNSLSPGVQSWLDSQLELLEAQNSFAAAEKMQGLAEDIADLSSGYQGTNAQIAAVQKQHAQILNDLLDIGQLTTENTTKAQQWLDASTQAITNDEAARLQSQLNQALGNTAELRAEELAALLPVNRALKESVWAAEAQKTALDEAQTAAEKMQGLAEDIADLSSGYQGTNAQIAAVQKQHAQILNDLLDIGQLTTENTTKAQQWIDASTQAITNAEAANLQTQLNQILGKTAELRAEELAALLPVNRALKESVWAAEALKTALDEAQSAVDAAESKVQALRDEGMNKYLAALEKEREAKYNLLDIAKDLDSYINGIKGKTKGTDFGDLVSKALRGDQEAMSALPGAADEAMEAARQSAKSSAAYQIEQGKILASLQKVSTYAKQTGLERPVELTAAQLRTEMQTMFGGWTKFDAAATEAQLTLAQQYTKAAAELTATQATLVTAQSEWAAIGGILEEIRDNTGFTAVNTSGSGTQVEEMFTALPAALAARVAAALSDGAFLPTGFSASTYFGVEKNKDIADSWTEKTATAKSAFNNSADEYAKWHWLVYGQKEPNRSSGVTATAATANTAVTSPAATQVAQFDGVDAIVRLMQIQLDMEDVATKYLISKTPWLADNVDSSGGAFTQRFVRLMQIAYDTTNAATTTLRGATPLASFLRQIRLGWAADATTKKLLSTYPVGDGKGGGEEVFFTRQISLAWATGDWTKSLMSDAPFTRTFTQTFTRDMALAWSTAGDTSKTTGSTTLLRSATPLAAFTRNMALAWTGETYTTKLRSSAPFTETFYSTFTRYMRLAWTDETYTATLRSSEPFTTGFNRTFTRYMRLAFDLTNAFTKSITEGTHALPNLSQSISLNIPSYTAPTLPAIRQDVFINFVSADQIKTQFINELTAGYTSYKATAVGSAMSFRQFFVDKYNGGNNAFATGGVFTNSLVNSPTQFEMGLMGEAGPEAIMPLTRMSNGNLGVEAQMPDWSTYGRGDHNSAALVAEIKALREEVKQLRTENNAGNAANAANTQKTSRILQKWDVVGTPVVITE
jgi:hypothetical protein